MNKIGILLSVCALTFSVQAGWWPFGSKDGSKDQPRISELMEPASVLIDSAADLAEEGKISESVDAYKRALLELDRIELENADRAQSAAFATLRNKRAYVNAAIDSLLLKQAQQNARAVAVTDTTELEKRYAQLKKGETLSDEKKQEIAEKKVTEIEEHQAAAVEPEKKPAAADRPRPAKLQELLAKDPSSRRARLLLAADDMKRGDYAAALLSIEGLLAERPNDAASLNLRAAVETEQGEYKKAERTLDQSIRSNPRSHYAYYNMARLLLQTRGVDGKEAAQRYYQTGRTYGGPVDARLEERLK